MYCPPEPAGSALAFRREAGLQELPLAPAAVRSLDELRLVGLRLPLAADGGRRPGSGWVSGRGSGWGWGWG